MEYPIKPFGFFLVLGSEFRGFHIRFRDIARGGIRVVRSRNKEAYSINLRSLLDENYNLAATQQRKNKDIPEGGSKGTILLDMDHQDKAFVAFEKYVDSILDLLIVGESPGIKEKIVDLYNKPEILFFGPDEGTADMMDWFIFTDLGLVNMHVAVEHHSGKHLPLVKVNHLVESHTIFMY
jgi:glutamate dehydrogenase